MHARDIAESDLFPTADAVRLIRAAEDGTRAPAVIERLTALHPQADADSVLRWIGNAARLMD